MSPPYGAVTNRLPFIAASLRRVYTAGGFLSNSGGRTWALPLRGDGFPRQCGHWLGMTARQCRANGASYPKGICSAALHCRTPSPTVVMRQVRLSFRRGRCPHRPPGKAVFCGGTHGSRPTKNHGRPNVKRHIPLTASSGCPPRRRAKSRIRPRCGREWPRRSAAPAPPAPDWC